MDWRERFASTHEGLPFAMPDPIKYVHLGGTEILIKACFREGIDTPIELYLADDRIIKPIELDIYYSTDRINYYTKICNSAITTG